MSVYMKDLRYSVQSGGAYEIAGLGRTRMNAPRMIEVEMTLLTDDERFVELLQRVMSRSARFEDVVVALAKAAMVADDSYGESPNIRTTSRAAEAKIQVESMMRLGINEAALTPYDRKRLEEETLQALASVAAATGMSGEEVAKMARELGVLPSPALARNAGPLPSPSIKTAPSPYAPAPPPKPKPKPSRMGALEFDDDDEEKKR